MVGGWIGVDLDGTLAHYDGWKGIEHIGAPIPLMVERVKKWLSEGKEVRIFTARVTRTDLMTREEIIQRANIIRSIQSWCLEHIGLALPVTNVKDFGMVELWDDRAIQVVPNTGERVG